MTKPDVPGYQVPDATDRLVAAYRQVFDAVDSFNKGPKRAFAGSIAFSIVGLSHVIAGDQSLGQQFAPRFQRQCPHHSEGGCKYDG